MEPNLIEAKNVQAELALKQLEHREALIKEIKNGYSRQLYFREVIVMLCFLALWWASRRVWTSADTTLLIFITGATTTSTISINNRINALLKLLETDGIFKTSGTGIKKEQA